MHRRFAAVLLVRRKCWLSSSPPQTRHSTLLARGRQGSAPRGPEQCRAGLRRTRLRDDGRPHRRHGGARDRATAGADRRRHNEALREVRAKGGAPGLPTTKRTPKETMVGTY